MRVVLADIEEQALDLAIAELKNAGRDAVGVVTDVSQPDSVDALAQRALDAYGAVHVVCNNAGVLADGDNIVPLGGGAPAQLWEQPLEDWQWTFGVNFWGVVYGIRAFVPILLEQDEGHVVSTASMAGLVPGGGIYGVTKHGVVSLSETLFGELALRGGTVGVSVLCPGFVSTNILESERNRPEAPREDPGEVPPQFEMFLKMFEDLVKRGLPPVEVGRIVVDAIRNRRFYVLTHPWKNMIEHRMRNILEDRDPTGVMPPGMPDLLGQGQGE